MSSPFEVLQFETRTALPLTEISAFALRQGADGREVVAVADDDFGILRVPFDGGGSLGEVDRCDAWRSLPVDVLAASEGSEFEGVACDGDGRVLLLQEGPSRVLVLSPALDRLLQTIQLTVEPDEPGFGKKWHKDDNARGEALLLMRDGHLLVAKQRKPIRLIEFGPASDDPLGVSPDTLLADGEPFAVPAGEAAASYVVLASWGLAGVAKDDFESVNDIAADADGRLFVLSSRSRRIACIQERLRPDEEQAAVTRVWDLPGEVPGGEDDRPEALALLSPGAALVGIDTKKPGDNVALVRGLDA
jgi:hypothetical protein